MDNLNDLDELSTLELLRLFSGVLGELRSRGVTRSANNPVADYAEGIVAEALDLDLAAKSTTGYDAKDSGGLRYEIKARRLTKQNGSRQLSAIRGLESQHFEFLVGVLFGEDFRVERACLVPYEVVVNNSSFRTHTNAWVFHLRDEVWLLPGVRDPTDRLQRTQRAS